MAEVRLTAAQVRQPELLPGVCVRCGAPATHVLTRRFVWWPASGTGSATPRSRTPDPLVLLQGSLAAAGVVLSSLEWLRSAEGRRRIFRGVVAGLVAAFVALVVLLLLGVGVGQMVLIVAAMGVVGLFTLLYLADASIPGGGKLEATATLPLCDRHRNHWLGHSLGVLAFAVGLTGAGMTFLFVLVDQGVSVFSAAFPAWLLAGLVLAAGAVVAATFWLRGPVRVKEAGPDHVTLSGVSPVFVQALQAPVAIVVGRLP